MQLLTSPQRFCVLVSRFNWPHPVWKTRPRQAYEDWLEIRLKIFASTTVRSIKNCYVKPDVWLILGADDPTNIGVTVEELASVSGVECRFCAFRGMSVVVTLREELRDELSKVSEVMTSRLDTDDLVASDFFARLRTVSIDHEPDIQRVGVSFPGGANIDMVRSQIFYSAYPNNPFISLIERIKTPDDFLSVMSFGHVDFETLPHRIYLRSFYPMWASCVHDDNLANQSLVSTNQQELVRQPSLLKKFGLDSNWG